MPSSGSDQLRAISVRLKALGDRELRLQFTRGLRAAAKPLVDEVKQAAERQLPHRGGLNRQVAAQRITTSIRTGAKTAGVRLTTKAPDTAMTDRGYVRHPVFGDRQRWVTQRIPGAEGWWSQTLAHSAPLVTPELMAVLRETAAEIQRRV